VVLDERALNIFTDGSSFTSPRRGGSGFLLVTVDEHGHEVIHPFQPAGYRGGTNQQMEIVAAIDALKFIIGRYCPVDVRDFTKVVINTDSLYLSDGYAAARITWPTNGWMTRDGNPVVNADLWKELMRVASKVGKRVEIKWYKGHSAANPHNKTADKLAKASAAGPLRAPIRHTRVRRKTTDKVTDAGSIEPHGQDLTVRIVTDDWLRVQRMYMYKCEVVSPESEYFGNVDNFFSDIFLKAGHVYSVRLNDEPRRPRIEHVYGEVLPPS
jgi:ribonuclease HI